MSEVVIFGLGDYARTAATYLLADSPHTIAAFTANADRIDRSELLERPVVPFEQLLEVLSRPFDERAEFERYSSPAAPEERVLQTFCGT